MSVPIHPDLSPAARIVQESVWKQKSPGEKIELVGLLWLQARELKRATLRSLHPRWDEAEVELAVREAMSGRRS